MGTISKELAGQIAFKLTEKSRIAADNLHVEYRELVTVAYEAQTPKEVKDCFKKNPDWFYTKATISFNGHGFQWESVTGTRQIIANGGTSANLTLNNKISDQLQKAKRTWDKAKDKYKDLKVETTNALLALKTHANIRKEFPEAIPMLPPPISNALIVSFDSLRHKIKNQPEVKEKFVEIEN